MEIKLISTIVSLTIDRLKSGIFHDENLKPYKKDYLEMVLNYSQNEERYEDCVIVLNVIKNRFDHECISNFRDF